MDYSDRHSHAQRRVAGFTFVILFHLFLIHALATGMARRVVEFVHSPIETKVIEEIKPPPQPAEVVPPTARLESLPPPPFIPPPEVQIAAPPPVQNTIAAVTNTAPPSPQAITPTRPLALPTEPTGAIARAAVSAAVVCSNYAAVMGDTAYPREALMAHIDKGEALIQFTVTPGGHVKDIKVVHATHPIFARNSMRIVSEYRCQGQSQDVLVQVPFGYRLE